MVLVRLKRSMDASSCSWKAFGVSQKQENMWLRRWRIRQRVTKRRDGKVGSDVERDYNEASQRKMTCDTLGQPEPPNL